MEPQPGLPLFRRNILITKDTLLGKWQPQLPCLLRSSMQARTKAAPVSGVCNLLRGLVLVDACSPGPPIGDRLKAGIHTCLSPSHCCSA